MNITLHTTSPTVIEDHFRSVAAPNQSNRNTPFHFFRLGNSIISESIFNVSTQTQRDALQNTVGLLRETLSINHGVDVTLLAFPHDQATHELTPTHVNFILNRVDANNAAINEIRNAVSAIRDIAIQADLLHLTPEPLQGTVNNIHASIVELTGQNLTHLATSATRAVEIARNITRTICLNFTENFNDHRATLNNQLTLSGQAANAAARILENITNFDFNNQLLPASTRNALILARNQITTYVTQATDAFNAAQQVHNAYDTTDSGHSSELINNGAAAPQQANNPTIDGLAPGEVEVRESRPRCTIS